MRVWPKSTKLFVMAVNLSVVLLMSCSLMSCVFAKDPIVIIPGVMGSQLESRLHKTVSTHFYCRHSYNSWYRLWLNLNDIIPVSDSCFKENIKLHYNSTTGKYTNTDGVEIRVVDFGNTTGIETLDPNLKSANYFNVFIDYLIKKGYTRGIDLRAAPFDWRLGPVQLTEQNYYQRLKQLIQTTYTSQGRAKVTLIAHSMGSLVSYYFLTKAVNQTWKDTYLKQYISLAGPWAGCSRALRALVSGDTDQIFKLSIGTSIRPMERSFPSDYWLLPAPSNSTWNESMALITTPTRSYSAYDLPKLIKDLNYSDGNSMYAGVANASPFPMTPPNVPTHCVYGHTLKTEESYNYGRGKFPNGTPHVLYGMGDGTVSLPSLRVCREWVGKQAWPVKWYEIDGIEHFGMLNDERVLNLVGNLVMT